MLVFVVFRICDSPGFPEFPGSHEEKLAVGGETVESDCAVEFVAVGEAVIGIETEDELATSEAETQIETKSEAAIEVQVFQATYESDDWD